jgi:hypothetical protein
MSDPKPAKPCFVDGFNPPTMTAAAPPPMDDPILNDRLQNCYSAASEFLERHCDSIYMPRRLNDLSVHLLCRSASYIYTLVSRLNKSINEVLSDFGGEPFSYIEPGLLDQTSVFKVLRLVFWLNAGVDMKSVQSAFLSRLLAETNGKRKAVFTAAVDRTASLFKDDISAFLYESHGLFLIKALEVFDNEACEQDALDWARVTIHQKDSAFYKDASPRLKQFATAPSSDDPIELSPSELGELYLIYSKEGISKIHFPQMGLANLQLIRVSLTSVLPYVSKISLSLRDLIGAAQDL